MSAMKKSETLALMSAPLSAADLSRLDRKNGYDAKLTATHADGRTVEAKSCYDLMVAGGWGLDATKRTGWTVRYETLSKSAVFTVADVLKVVGWEGDDEAERVERAEGDLR